MQFISLIILSVSSAYLTWRTVIQWARQRRSYQKVPFGDIDAALRGGGDDRWRAALVGVAVGDALGAPRASAPATASSTISIRSLCAFTTNPSLF